MSLKFSKLGARQKESDIARLMTLALQRPELLSLAAGFTDNDTLPLEGLTKIAVELNQIGDRRILQYGSNQGSPELREALTRRLEAQDGSVGRYESDRGFITNGSQQALYLAVQTLCDAGDIILVEQPTYFVFLEMLRGLGVEAVSMPALANGDVDTVGLRAMLDGYVAKGEIDRVKAVYLVSYYANPSGHSVTSECKAEVVKTLERFDGTIALFEDAAYRELYYETPFDAKSCLEVAGESSCVPVFYSTTLTKPFASGLKVGFAYCSDDDWKSRMLAIKGQQDFGTANYNQALVTRGLSSGLFDAHLLTLRDSYFTKMKVLDEALSEGLAGSGWTWQRPAGGLYIWVRAPEGVETGFDSEFHRLAIEAGVMYVPGELCFAERLIKNRLRLSFGTLPSLSLKIAAERLATAVSTVS